MVFAVKTRQTMPTNYFIAVVSLSCWAVDLFRNHLFWRMGVFPRFVGQSFFSFSPNFGNQAMLKSKADKCFQWRSHLKKDDVQRASQANGFPLIATDPEAKHPPRLGLKKEAEG